MANFNKSFNFRGGFQVDETTFIVRGEKVGIGSSVPDTLLDVNGTITAKGLAIDSSADVIIESANVGFLSATTIHVGVASISAGIITSATPTGIVTYYGDARFLQGLPTSQWIDTDVGLGYTSIYAAGNVGVDTTDPRYAFQVGGVPFPTIDGPPLPAQDGVGIENGNVYASGIVSTRGEFIGLGSNITAIDGSNITVGAIGSMAYGPLIVTEEVIADRFTGIASTAISVTPDATLEFDTATANEFNAVNRFVSTTGKLQIGDDSTSSAVGDIDVFKTGSNSSVYSLSNQVSKLFVGAQRQSGQARQFGGLRHGLVGSDPLTQINDLDLVNYDIGNLNFYLHSGSGGPGITTGAFRWIYGQTGFSLAELSKEGVFSLKGNGVSGSIVLEVAGISSFSDAVYINGDLNVPAGNNVDIGADITVSGNFDFSGSTITFPDQVTMEELIISDTLTVGNPLSDFVTITSTQISNGNSIIGNGTINSTSIQGDTINGTSVNATELQYTTSLVGPQFSINSLGDLQASSITSASASLSSIISTDITTGSLSVTSSLSAINANVTTITSDTVNSTNINGTTLDISGTSTLNDISSNSIDTPLANITAVNTNSIAPLSSSSISIPGDIDGAGNGTITDFSELNSSLVNCTTLRVDQIEIAPGLFSSTSVRLTFISDSVPDGAYVDLTLTPLPSN
ncbi:hemagluttinin-like outer membrane protein [Synechococcus phage S-CAM7]|uniref:Hemagluttinin-like outer membrane protein n=1 Tax=Synechococcus phage S-CAM7 TaxID=1883368 RepID=A0A1D8KU78_9CAUD|nr:hemagluttinin-like outer membrane protein [Synechococcus phage S-CAM7]